MIFIISSKLENPENKFQILNLAFSACAFPIEI